MGELSGMGIDLSGWGTGLYSGDSNAGTAVGVPSPIYGGFALPGDVADAQQMQAWNPAPAADQGAPWWAGIMAYGVTRAIDNQFPQSPTGVMGNTYPGSTAGTNGRTYTQRPAGAGGGAVQATVRSPIGGLRLKSDPLLLAVLAGVAYLFLK